MSSNTAVESFLSEINAELNPVLEVVHDYRTDFSNLLPNDTENEVISFNVQLCSTPYADVTQVVIEKALKDLVNSLFKKHFGHEPTFNNTGRCFFTVQRKAREISVKVEL